MFYPAQGRYIKKEYTPFGIEGDYLQQGFVRFESGSTTTTATTWDATPLQAVIDFDTLKVKNCKLRGFATYILGNDTDGEETHAILYNMTDDEYIDGSEAYMTGSGSIVGIKSEVFDLSDYIGFKRFRPEIKVTGGTGTYYYSGGMLHLLQEIGGV